MNIPLNGLAPKNFKAAALAAGATATLGDGVEVGEKILVCIKDASTAVHATVLTYGSTSGGADDPPTPAEATDNDTGGAGIVLLAGQNVPNVFVINAGRAVKYVKVKNIDGTNVIDAIFVSFLK